ncbi:MAG: DUF871 domain-containing protein [Acidaminococcaceae bacterium]|nr:DUF871 domain-containing protein [Acidaminococcaceae bacterium]
MKLGISIYPGLDADREKSLLLLQNVAALGYTRIFSSLHIPESNTAALREKALYLFAFAESLGLEVIADVSPLTLKILDIPELTPSRLKELHITTARFDYGIGPETIADFSREMNVQLNASTLRSVQLNALLKANADFSRIDGLHNFYPRPHTGLSAETIQRQNALLHRHDISAGVFTASQTGRRGPLYAGLPTMESLRGIAPCDAAPILTAIGCDSLIIGDSNPALTELRALADPETLAKADARYSRKALPPKKEWQPDEPLPLHIHVLSDAPFVKELLSRSYTNRPDPAADVIRATESRDVAKAFDITPERNENKLIIEMPKEYAAVFAGPQHLANGKKSSLLPVGTVLLDNNNYGRYKGELQILNAPQPMDTRSNVVAQVTKEDVPLLSLISAEIPFRFIME